MRRNSTKIKAKKMKENPSCYVCQNSTFYILELHHVVPIRSGGADCETNTELLCPNCHAFLHFMISDKASDYIPEDETISETISRYTNNPISKYRMSKLINRWVVGLEEKINNGGETQ